MFGAPATASAAPRVELSRGRTQPPRRPQPAAPPAAAVPSPRTKGSCSRSPASAFRALGAAPSQALSQQQSNLQTQLRQQQQVQQQQQQQQLKQQQLKQQQLLQQQQEQQLRRERLPQLPPLRAVSAPAPSEASTVSTQRSVVPRPTGTTTSVDTSAPRAYPGIFGVHGMAPHHHSGSAELASLAHEAAMAAAAASAAAGKRSTGGSKPNAGKHAAAAAAAAAASRLIHAEAEASGSSRGASGNPGINRRAWSAEEDETIRNCVAQMGMRWRLIAPLLPGRSDDSVRNRWKRLTEEDSEAEGAAAALRNGPAGASGSGASGGGASGGGSAVDGAIGGGGGGGSGGGGDAAPAPGGRRVAKPNGRRASAARQKDDDSQEGEGGQRVSWSPHEDQVIVRAVQELGPRWCFVAARLPSRTDQAVRNRWNRLQQRARVQARTMLSRFNERNAHPPIGRVGS